MSLFARNSWRKSRVRGPHKPFKNTIFVQIFKCCFPHLPVVNKFLRFWLSQTDWNWVKLIRIDWNWLKMIKNRSKWIESRRKSGGKPIEIAWNWLSANSHGRWGEKAPKNLFLQYHRELHGGAAEGGEICFSGSPDPCCHASKCRPAPRGGMDWWRMEWPFSRVRKIFFRGRNFQENPWNSAERAIFAKFQAQKFENSEPEKLQFHTPSHSIPPLDSLLKWAFSTLKLAPPWKGTPWSTAWQ